MTVHYTTQDAFSVGVHFESPKPLARANLIGCAVYSNGVFHGQFGKGLLFNVDPEMQAVPKYYLGEWRTQGISLPIKAGAWDGIVCIARAFPFLVVFLDKLGRRLLKCAEAPAGLVAFDLRLVRFRLLPFLLYKRPKPLPSTP